MVRSQRRLVPFVSLAAAAVLAVWTWPYGLEHIATEDVNQDGRPDVWRFYDDRGELTHASIDTNFDGRPDREEEYEAGALRRRESDRNFDGQIDLVEDFDGVSGDRVREVFDVDFDGRADLLVFFHDGRPVRSEWASQIASAARRSSENRAGDSTSSRGLIPLENPFDELLSMH